MDDMLLIVSAYNGFLGTINNKNYFHYNSITGELIYRHISPQFISLNPNLTLKEVYSLSQVALSGAMHG